MAFYDCETPTVGPTPTIVSAAVRWTATNQVARLAGMWGRSGGSGRWGGKIEAQVESGSGDFYASEHYAVRLSTISNAIPFIRVHV